MSTTVSDSWRRRISLSLFIIGVAGAIHANAVSQSETAQPSITVYQQAIASAMRTPEDREADAKRKPLDFLQFAKVEPGMRVMDVSAGAGYTTQLLALVVGNTGTVWAQTPAMRPGLQERLAQNPQKNIVPVVRPFDDPLPPDLPKLDLITLIWNYHDIAYEAVDRAKMNQRLVAALKPGGHLIVIDHSAKAGSGTAAAKSLHRIDEGVVKDELQRAGFRLEEESNAFRNAADPRDEIVFHMTIPVDNFALRFVKP